MLFGAYSFLDSLNDASSCCFRTDTRTIFQGCLQGSILHILADFLHGLQQGGRIVTRWRFCRARLDPTLMEGNGIPLLHGRELRLRMVIAFFFL